MCSTIAALVRRCAASVIFSTQALQSDGAGPEGGVLPDRQVTGSPHCMKMHSRRILLLLLLLFFFVNGRRRSSGGFVKQFRSLMVERRPHVHIYGQALSGVTFVDAPDRRNISIVAAIGDANVTGFHQ